MRESWNWSQRTSSVSYLHVKGELCVYGELLPCETAGYHRGHTLSFNVSTGNKIQTAGIEKRYCRRFKRRIETRYTDWSSKFKGKAYADEERGTVIKLIKVGNAVLLRAEKSNKLSSNFCPSSFKFVQKTGSEVSVKNDLRSS